MRGRKHRMHPVEIRLVNPEPIRRRTFFEFFYMQLHNIDKMLSGRVKNVRLERTLPPDLHKLKPLKHV